MKRNFKFYALSWILILGLFNLVTFLVPELPNAEKYTASFWIGYSFITAAYIGQFVCAWFALDADNAKKTFYRISLLKSSYSGLVSTFIVGLVCMIIPPIPYWIAAILCSAILVMNVWAFAKAKLAVDYVSSIDERVESATEFICVMKADSESLLARANGDEIKDICKKVHEAFKFSDPVSKAGLKEIEAEIKNHFELLKKAVSEGEKETVMSESNEILALITERNSKCKIMK